MTMAGPEPPIHPGAVEPIAVAVRMFPGVSGYGIAGRALNRDVRAAPVPGDDLVPVAVPRDPRFRNMGYAVLRDDHGRTGLRLWLHRGNSATGRRLGQESHQPDQNEAASLRLRAPRSRSARPIPVPGHHFRPAAACAGRPRPWSARWGRCP